MYLWERGSDDAWVANEEGEMDNEDERAAVLDGLGSVLTVQK